MHFEEIGIKKRYFWGQLIYALLKYVCACNLVNTNNPFVLKSSRDRNNDILVVQRTYVPRGSIVGMLFVTDVRKNNNQCSAEPQAQYISDGDGPGQ